jgi:alpha-beta hydrolase superfamily lysophospholipase
MLLPLSILSIFNGCAWNSMRKEEDSLVNGSIQQRFSEIRSDGISPAVLLIHGYGGSPFDVKPLCDALEKRGYAFHAILLPGHGTTPRDLKNIKERDWLDATRRAYDELKQKYGTISVVGFSMGGGNSHLYCCRERREQISSHKPLLQSKAAMVLFRQAGRLGPKTCPNHSLRQETKGRADK